MKEFPLHASLFAFCSLLATRTELGRPNHSKSMINHHNKEKKVVE